MIIEIPSEFDSKFRFIIVAAERAKQIQNGAPAKIVTRIRKPAYVSIQEVEQGVVPYSILEEEQEEEDE